jgi:hypothetical protein
VQQVGRIYETASATVGELAEASTKHLKEVTEASVKTIDQARAKFVKTFRRLDTTLWDHPILLFAMMVLTTVVLSTGTSMVLSRFTTERTITTAVEASTTATQETLKPVIEKIERQTQSLDVTYQQSQAFEHYLLMLPAGQRDRKRVELIEGAKKQRAAEDGRRRAD